MTTSIRPLIAGNWKMNGTSASVPELVAIGKAFTHGFDVQVDALICPPATLVARAHDVLSSTPVRVGGQDCAITQSGAHTGDISAEMLKDAGAGFVIVGHSERRTDHGETNEIVQKKALAAWRAGLTAIICIGETQSQREKSLTLDVLTAQIEGSVPQGATASNTVIAYEPVWAIGTGLTPTLPDVAAAHAHIRSELSRHLGEGFETIRILYGGSVKPSNAQELLSVQNVNGALVGGASLKASDFVGIAEACRPA
ncbi:MAG: triose-phosphate isomerase [Rhizobiaceae bacterium]|nr:triose-phosphate isomerase [Rhizobiaceae bacterium]